MVSDGEERMRMTVKGGKSSGGEVKIVCFVLPRNAPMSMTSKAPTSPYTQRCNNGRQYDLS